MTVPVPVPVQCAYPTPRISLGLPETTICACSWCPGDRRVVCYRAGVRRWGVPGWVWVGTWEGGIPGITPPPTTLVLPGPNHCQTAVVPCPQGTPGLLLSPSAHPGSRTRSLRLLGPIRRDSGQYILKLVNIPECRHKTLMRPAMLPVSKTRPKSTTLNSPVFHNP